MKTYKIALIIEEIDQSYQNAILNGVAAAAKEYSMSVFAFVSFSGAMIDPRHDAGEFKIFSLPDFSKFDGAILLTNTIAYKPVVDDILERIKAAGIPAVSVDNDIPCFYHIGIDNKTAMRSVVEHLINTHGYRRFFYISGPKENPESADRLSAFLSVLKEKDIPIGENDIYYGDFRAHSGRAAAKELLSRGEPLPDAIICANDVTASAAVSYLVSNGVSVPGDIAVTGFDNTYASQNYRVELTSVDRPLGLSGKLACKMLYNRFNSLPQERNVILKMSPRFTESCGCVQNARNDLEAFKEMNYRNYISLERSRAFMSTVNRTSTGLLGCDDFDEYIAHMKNIVLEMRPDEYYLCLCDGWDRSAEFDGGAGEPPPPIAVPTEYTDEFTVPIAYKDGAFFDAGKVKRGDLIPGFGEDFPSGSIYYNIPLHFGERLLGYMTLRNPIIQVDSTMFETFCISVSNSLENIRKIICLEKALDRLGELYARDSFSGVYNRNGFVKASAEVYRDCAKNGKKIMLMFIDLDGLKRINDVYGHGVGDEAICDIADVLRKSCRNGEIYCRFGGDEFIVFGANYTDEAAMRLKKKIQSNIGAVNATGKKPYVLSASVGYVVDVPKEGEGVFRFVTEADKIMYEEKRRKKQSKYLKS